METRFQQIQTRPAAGEQASARWKDLYMLGGLAALISLLFFPIQIAIFFTNPYPVDVVGWFALLNHDPLVGLIELDLLIMVDEALVILIFLALCVALKEINPSMMLVSAVIGTFSGLLYLATNPAIGMLNLSAQFAGATNEAQRNALLAAGQSLLATWEGSGWEAAYFLGSIAPIIISVVMLRSRHFRKATAYLGILANVVALGIYIPTVGIYISIFSVVILWAWYLFAALDLIRLAKASPGGTK